MPTVDTPSSLGEKTAITKTQAREKYPIKVDILNVPELIHGMLVGTQMKARTSGSARDKKTVRSPCFRDRYPARTISCRVVSTSLPYLTGGGVDSLE